MITHNNGNIMYWYYVSVLSVRSFWEKRVLATEYIVSCPFHSPVKGNDPVVLSLSRYVTCVELHSVVTQ